MASSLAALLKRSDIEDHDEVLQAADAALAHDQADVAAQRARVVALLKLDRYADAAAAVEAGAPALRDAARLEHAYALYKAGRTAEALQIVRAGAGRGLKHVEAQALYRAEEFGRAAQIYQQLSASPEEDAVADLRINAAAVEAQAQWKAGDGQGQAKKLGREDLDAFEAAFNAACGSIARGEFGQAEVLLKRAEGLCSASDELSDSEKVAELLPIRIQRGYVLFKLGRLEEAEALNGKVDLSTITDATTKLIATLNSFAVASNSPNPYLVARIFDRKPSDQLFGFQRAALGDSARALDFMTGKHDGIASDRISSKKSSPLDPGSNSLSVVSAAARAKSKTGKDALKHILPLLEKRPDDIGLALVTIQLYVSIGKHASATTVLESLLSHLSQSGSADARFAPGLVGALVSQYASQRRRTDQQRELSDAATHWLAQPHDNRPPGAAHLLKAAGAALLESPEPARQRLAAAIFADLGARDATDRFAAAGAIAADPASASPAQLAALTPLSRLLAGVDAAALERAGVAQPPTSAGVTRKRPAAGDAAPAAAKPHKKPRASRLPKDYDAGRAPDPERWLPLRDRSSYRPKGRKGKAKANLLSQGAAPAAEGSEGSRPGTPAGEVIRKKPQASGGGAKKKKGKGKW